MEVQSQISAAKLARKVGRTLDVLIDGHQTVRRGRNRHTVGLARSSADAPDIDGVVRIAGAELAPGSLARVVVTGSDAHDLEATLAA
jgi:ribosomal protein S12 methylthiotransferase